MCFLLGPIVCRQPIAAYWFLSFSIDFPPFFFLFFARCPCLAYCLWATNCGVFSFSLKVLHFSSSFSFLLVVRAWPIVCERPIAAYWSPGRILKLRTSVLILVWKRWQCGALQVHCSYRCIKHLIL